MKFRTLRNNIVEVKYFGTVIICVYLKYDNESYEHTQIFREELSFLKDRYIALNKLKYDILITGDFNTDFRRQRDHTNLLNDFCTDLELISSDLSTYQEFQYSMIGPNYTSWIDHLFFNKFSTNVKYTKILHKTSKKVGHLPLESLISVSINKKEYDLAKAQILKESETKNKYLIDWSDADLISDYNLLLQVELMKIQDEVNGLLNSKSYDEAESRLSILIDKVTYIIQDVCCKVGQKQQKRRHYIKNKDWWSDELNNLMCQRNRLWMQYNETKDDTYKFEAKRIEKLMENKEKTNKNGLLYNEQLDINTLFYKGDLMMYQKIDNILNEKMPVNIDHNEIAIEYEKLFNDNIMVVSPLIENATRVVENFKNANDKVEMRNSDLSLDEIKDTLKTLTNGSSTGISGLSNEMFKYATNTSLAEVLYAIFTIMFAFGCVPENFNTSVIVPIIKDNNKSNCS